MDEFTDFVDHEDIYVSPSKRSTPSTGRARTRCANQKSGRQTSPKRSQSIEIIDPVVKRKRGRPKKQKLPEMVIPIDAGDEKSSSNLNQEKLHAEESLSITSRRMNSTHQRSLVVQLQDSDFEETMDVKSGNNGNNGTDDEYIEHDKHRSDGVSLKKRPSARDDLDFNLEVGSRSSVSSVNNSPRKKLVFRVDKNTKGENSSLGNQESYDAYPSLDKVKSNFTLNKDYRPTPLPREGEYVAPPDKSQAYFFDGFEGYIDQTKPIKGYKKSKNSMSMAPNITRDEYNTLSLLSDDLLHKTSRNGIQALQQKLFQQFTFELLQGFNLLFYGIGSKRQFLESFVLNFLSMKIALIQNPAIKDNDDCIPVLILNGYNTITQIREFFSQVCTILMKDEEISDKVMDDKYWKDQVDAQIENLVDFFKGRASHVKLIILIHNIHGPSIRRDTFQSKLAYLAQIKQVALICSADNFQTPLLWDYSRSQNLNFIYHDITNFEPYRIETINFKGSLELTQGSSSLFNAESAKYVLGSLTENSKKMYKLLLKTLMENIEATDNSKVQLESKRCQSKTAVPFSKLYQLCAADFIASNELSLRSLLSEFVDHKMAVVSKDKRGKELISTNYTYGEMNNLLVDVLNNM